MNGKWEIRSDGIATYGCELIDERSCQILAPNRMGFCLESGFHLYRLAPSHPSSIWPYLNMVFSLAIF